jgi:hypothetical protein
MDSNSTSYDESKHHAGMHLPGQPSGLDGESNGVTRTNSESDLDAILAEVTKEGVGGGERA